jgi:hypothetical protein
LSIPSWFLNKNVSATSISKGRKLRKIYIYMWKGGGGGAKARIDGRKNFNYGCSNVGRDQFLFKETCKGSFVHS